MMLLCTTHAVPERPTIRTLGLVRGTAVRSRHIGKDIVAYCRNMVGGEIHEYVKLAAEAREQALDRMVEEAKRLGANGVVGIRFATSSIMGAAAELVVYGTAVLLADGSSAESTSDSPDTD